MSSCSRPEPSSPSSGGTTPEGDSWRVNIYELHLTGENYYLKGGLCENQDLERRIPESYRFNKVNLEDLQKSEAKVISTLSSICC